MAAFYKNLSFIYSMMQENNLTIKTPEFLGGSIAMLLRVQAVLVFIGISGEDYGKLYKKLAAVLHFKERH